MDKYISYENTVEINKTKVFTNARIFSVEDVKDAIGKVPEKFYHLPLDKPKYKPKEKTQGRRATGSVRLSPAARVLVLEDRRKAAEIELFVKETCDRTLMPTSSEGDKQNCLVEAVFLQFSNSKYLLDEGYTDLHLRYQTLVHISENYAQYYDRLHPYMRESFKGWLERVLDATEELEEYFLIPMRQMCMVCITFLCYFSSLRVLFRNGTCYSARNKIRTVHFHTGQLQMYTYVLFSSCAVLFFTMQFTTMAISKFLVIYLICTCYFRT